MPPAPPNAPAPEAMISIRGIHKYFQVGDVEVRALRGIDLEIEQGSYVAIMGPSGSGKSTMLNLLGCLDRPTKGEYFLGGDDVARMDDDTLSGVRGKRLGFIFQSYNLIAQLTVIEIGWHVYKCCIKGNAGINRDVLRGYNVALL